MAVLDVKQGTSPIILGFPHTGTEVPTDIWERLNDNGKILPIPTGISITSMTACCPIQRRVRATFHRYVIDANRDPAGVSLYPGQNTTGLIPETDFDGKAIWKDGQAPSEADIVARLRDFHAPYHAALAAEIERVRAIHGVAILYDCHSIRSHIPFLFEGKLPDFNIGTDMGKTCDGAIEEATLTVVEAAEGYDSVLNGRFKGGWTTRHYGRPETGVHAIQMELAQSTHLQAEAPPFAYDTAKAERLRVHLKDILVRIEQIAPGLKR